jgi:hypothetical protein
MLAPSFRCDKVTPSSLELHYYSHRPALWPLVAGIVKGVAQKIYKYEPSSVSVALISGREMAEAKTDHEVLLITFPYQTLAAAYESSCISEAEVNLAVHPFHILVDKRGNLVQCGSVLNRVLPLLVRGSSIDNVFAVAHPHLAVERPFSSSEGWEKILVELHSPFLLTAIMNNSHCVSLKGQIFHKAADETLLFIGTPRCSNLDELKVSSLYISDFPLHDMSRDFLLLAEQRSIEVELKEKLEALTLDLRAEKSRSDALVQRMSVLLNCFPFDEKPSSQASRSFTSSHDKGLGQQSNVPPRSGDLSHEVVEAVRRSINPQLQLQGQLDTDQISIIEPLAHGSYGSVSRGLWQGVEVALKTMILPPELSGRQKRERMAIMEVRRQKWSSEISS